MVQVNKKDYEMFLNCLFEFITQVIINISFVVKLNICSKFGLIFSLQFLKLFEVNNHQTDFIKYYFKRNVHFRAKLSCSYTLSTNYIIYHCLGQIMNCCIILLVCNCQVTYTNDGEAVSLESSRRESPMEDRRSW